MTFHCFLRPIRRHLPSSSYTIAILYLSCEILARVYEVYLAVTRSDVQFLFFLFFSFLFSCSLRMTFHCFLRPIRRHLSSSSYTTAILYLSCEILARVYEVYLVVTRSDVQFLFFLFFFLPVFLFFNFFLFCLISRRIQMILKVKFFFQFSFLSGQKLVIFW